MTKTRMLTLAFTIIIILALTLTTLNLKILQIHGQTSNPNPQLTITGLVGNPINLTISDLEAMPKTSEYAVMVCVSAPGTPLQQGTWTGVDLSYLLQLANVSSSAMKVVFFAPDGYSTDLTVQTAMEGSILLAYQKDNVSLGLLQLVVPGDYGYKWITDPTQIQLVNYNFLGTTESEGYSDDGTVSGAGGTVPAMQTSEPSSPNPITFPTPTSTQAPIGRPPTSTETQKPTPSAAVNPDQQSTSTFLTYTITGAVLMAISASAACIILARRKKTKL